MEQTKNVNKKPWFKKKRWIIPGMMLLSLIVFYHKTDETSQKVNAESTVEKASSAIKLDPSKFRILTTNHFYDVENFHILLTAETVFQDSLRNFITRFRNEFCTKHCNINLYDNESIKSLATKYPLSNKEYLKLADHCTAYSSFDVTEVTFYPYQDAHYERLGGKNWKKMIGQSRKR